VDLLEESLSDGTPEEIGAAWLVEVKRRIAEIDRGEATLVSSESVHQRMAEILERARAAPVAPPTPPRGSPAAAAPAAADPARTPAP
jgi:hypothetical protein